MTRTGPTTRASLNAALARQRWVEDGLCWECTSPRIPGQKRCPKHTEMHRVRQRARYAKRRAALAALDGAK